MSTRKYKFKVTSFADLAAQYPLAVKEVTIVKQKVDYAYVARLLDCALPVSGIEIEGEQTELTLAKKGA